MYLVVSPHRFDPCHSERREESGEVGAMLRVQMRICALPQNLRRGVYPEHGRRAPQNDIAHQNQVDRVLTRLPGTALRLLSCQPWAEVCRFSPFLTFPPREGPRWGRDDLLPLRLTGVCKSSLTL